MARHRLRIRALTVAAIVVSATALVWLVAFSPVFALDGQRVTVTGESSLVDKAGVQRVLHGVDGVPLPRLDTVALREDLVAVAGVKNVTITREWPRGLDVAVVPRVPVAVVPHGKQFVLVDEDGVQIGTAATAAKNLPQIAVPLDGKPESVAALRSALVLLNAIPDSLRSQIATVTATTQDSVTMRLRSGQTVLWGSSDDAALKIKVFEVLRAAPQNKQVKLFDVSSPTTPITRS